jgi:polyisoprenoid-binding protein YceI
MGSSQIKYFLIKNQDLENIELILQPKHKQTTTNMNKLLPVIALAILTACGGGGQKTVEAEEAKDVAEASADAVKMTVDTAQSVVTWIGSKPTGKHNGTIPITGGMVTAKGGDLESASFTFSIPGLKINDMEPENEFYGKLYGHLMSGDFFAADSFPTASFELVSVAAYDSSAVSDQDQFETEFTPATMSEFMVENPTHMITGNLTMRGNTKSISFPARVSMTDNSISTEAKFNIDRTDWGLMYGDESSVADKAKDKFIYNTVNVGISFVANAAEEPAM